MTDYSILILDADAWEAYKVKLDEDGKYSFRHNDSPPEYPCLVRSHFWDDPNGPYNYDHTFLTRAEVEALLAKFPADKTC